MKICLLLLLVVAAMPVAAEEVLRVTGPEPVAGQVAGLLADRVPGVRILRGPGAADLRIAVGARDFSEAVAGSEPVVGIALNRHSYRLAVAGRDGVHTALFWEPDPVRQLQLAHLLLPAARRAGVLLDTPDDELLARLRKEAKRRKIELVVGSLPSYGSLARALGEVLADSDFLLGIADPAVFSPANAKMLLLTSYRQGKPVIGPGQAYVEAGGLASLSSSLTDVVDELVEWLPALLLARDGLPPPRYATRFSILTNAQVARSLKLSLPATDSVDAALNVQGDDP